MANLAFKQGLWSDNMFGDSKREGSAIQNFSEGTIYVVTDQKAIYLDTYQNKAASTANQKRIRLQGTIQYYESLTAWSQAVEPPYNSDVIYFIADKNAFMRYDSSQPEGSKWVQLNTTAKTANELLAAIQVNAGAIAELEEKVANIEEAIGGTGGTGTSILDRLEQAEKDIDTVETKNTTQDGRLDAIEAVLGNTATTPDDTTVLGRLKEVEGDVSNLEQTTGEHGDLLNTIGGADGTGGKIGELTADMTAVENRATNLESRATAVEGRATALENALNDTTNGVLKRLDDIEKTDDAQDGLIAEQGALIEIMGGATGKAGEIGKLITRASDLETRATSVENRATALENEIGSNEDANTVKGRIAKLEETTATHTTEISELTDATEKNAANIEDLQKNKVDNSTYTTKMNALDQKDVALNTAITTLQNNFNTTSTDHGNRISSLEGRMSDAESAITTHDNEITNIKSAASALTQRVSAAEGTISNHTTEITNIKKAASDLTTRVAAAEGNITSLSGNLDDFKDTVAETYATKSELDEAETTLDNKITDHIKAANAMVYKEGVSSQTDLENKAAANTELSVGHTYIATDNFTLDGKTVYAGDILIASGTEDANGKLTVDTVEWVHVSSGYVLEHMPKIYVDEIDGIVLTSLNGEGTKGDLGSINVESTSDNITVTLDGDNNKISVGLVWDTF